MMVFTTDQLILVPDDIDLTRSPLAGHFDAETYVLGAFNPGLTRLANGSLLMIVRVAEALRTPIRDGHVHAIRWTDADGSARYVLDAWPLQHADTADPREFMLRGGGWKVMALTSLSWLLPVELSADGGEIVASHYDKAIAPTRSFQCYGIEDARISKVCDRYLMTTCSVSPERHSTTLYTSDNGLDWTFAAIVLDHQNKDMLIFEGLIDGRYWALTRPLAIFISPIRRAASGAPVHQSISPLPPTPSTGSRMWSQASARMPAPSQQQEWAATPRRS